MSLRVIALLALLVLTGCQLGQNTESSPGAIQAQLLAVLSAATEDYNSGDLQAYANRYTEDAMHISVRRPMVQGRAAIADFFARGMKMFTMESSEEVLDAEQFGDTAYLLFNATLTGKARDGYSIPPFTEKRTIMIIFKQTDGQWLIHRYVASFSPEAKPAPGVTKQ